MAEEKKLKWWVRFINYLRQPRCYRNFWRRCGGNCEAYSEREIKYGFGDKNDMPIMGHCGVIAAHSAIGRILRLLTDRAVREIIRDLIAKKSIS